MLENHTDTSHQSDLELEDYVEQTVEDYWRLHDPATPHLYAQLSCTRYQIGTWDKYGVRALPNEQERYASVHFRIPAALPAATKARLAEFAVQRIPYTDRDQRWDAVSGDGVTSTRHLWNCFVDSVLAAVNFAHAAIESAVWAHARGVEWDWRYAPPGRVEDKYEEWGDRHPLTSDIYHAPETASAATDPTTEPLGPREADVEF